MHSQVGLVINHDAGIHRCLKRLEEFIALSNLLAWLKSMQFLKYCVIWCMIMQMVYENVHYIRMLYEIHMK